MDLPDSTQPRLEEQDSAREQETPDGSVSFFVRLWTYGGPWQPLSAVGLDKDEELGALISNLITEGRGKVTERSAEMLVARFHAPFYALSAAKSLQQRLLTFQRKQPPEQIVPSILISGEKGGATAAGEGSAPKIMAAGELLAGGNTAQILVSEGIYEIARNAPGFQFNPKPVREAGEGGASEAIYELLWTDESTYGHLRDAGKSSSGITTAGRYQILAELGRGAMGVVYKAFDQLIGRTVALKTISINRNTPNREELVERLKQEAKAAGSLDHPNIITIYDVGQEEDIVYLSMQFVEGKTLLHVLTEGGLPPLPALVSYAEQICSAVGFAHKRGVIHRDLKPANLMLTGEGVIKVLDFGIAKVEDATLTQTGLVVGTPTHMAPEQASGKKIDHRADIFALGSVFYELFTREKPFKGDVTTVLYKIMHEDPMAPSLINPALPGGIDAIIRKALAKDPNDRFQSCEEMGKAFSEQAALLKTGAAAPSVSAVGGTVAIPAVRPAVASATSLRREPVVQRPQRRIWPWFVVVTLLAVAGVAALAFSVKARTGSFPPVVQKLAAAWQRVASHLGASGSNAPSPSAPSQPASSANSQADQNSPANSSANDRPANSAPGSPADTSTGTSSPEPTSSDSIGASTAPQTPAAGQPSVAPVQNQNSQPAVGNAGTTPASDSAQGKDDPTKDSSQSSAAANASSDPATEPATKKPVKSAPRGGAATVDGFSRRDVPELVRQADAAAGRGDYRLARYEYNLILKLDPGNAAARAGLRRAQAAQQDAQH
ncbi:MAG TPA: protein kinase [Candidatus Angelobacter sp.]|nr:protein kinase [Candidatus Angelobacter sp.]